MLRSILLPMAALAALGLDTSAQVTAYYPDNLANAGACNTIPFGSSFASNAKTFVSVIPASAVALAGGFLADIGFAHCSAGTMSAADAILGFGHLPSPTPTPLTFPTFDVGGNVTNPGGFLDFTVIYNSVTQGPIAYTYGPDTWSPLRLPLVAPFLWNGSNSVGFYLTMQNITSSFTAVHSDALVERRYAPGYRAAASNNSSLNLGPKMELNPVPGLWVGAGYDLGGATASLTVLNVPAAAVEGYTLVSLATTGPWAGGSLFGIVPDATTWTIIFSAPFPGSPFHWVPGIPGVFPAVPLTVPTAAMAPFTGQTWDLVAIALGPTFTLLDVSIVERTTW